MSVINVSDVFNRPPAIPEDALHYSLHLPDDLTDCASATTLATLMRSYVEVLLPGHLWHRDSFELKVVENPEGQGWILEGTMRVGDCVDDEWCAVWLLKELSAKWDVTISVFDSDGEFLLIEAAEALPSWVTPTNAENRVWIYQSRLHLIPLSHISAPSSKPRTRRYPHGKDSDDEGDFTPDQDQDDYISVSDALKVVRDPFADTYAPQATEQLAWKRISGYPGTALQHTHVTKAYLPVEIAKALAAEPSLIQKPVETFYTRDALQLRAAHKMSRFSPEPSILTHVKMTRTAYAQLIGQKFYPPKVFGRWTEQEGTREWRWRDIGMKIACGFEMTYQESKDRSNASRITTEAMESSAAARKETLRRNPDYARYIHNLVASGYFKSELEGSQLWNDLEDKAINAFLDARREDDASRPSFATAVHTALCRARGASLSTTGEEDSDEWLNVNAQTFDSMLEENFGTTDSSNVMDVDGAAPESAENRAAQEQAARLHKFATKIEEFVEGEGDIEGARFADEQFSDEEFSDDTESDNSEESIPRPAAKPHEHMGPVERAQRQTAMDRLVPPLDPSDYGRMPASYYTNSQRVAPTTMETELREDIPSVGHVGLEAFQRPIRPPIIPRDQYDGVDSDNETDEEDEEGDEDEEDRPLVVGDIEVDMEAEEEEFLEFARQALGVSDEQWGNIVRERKDRGAYVPSQVVAENKSEKPAYTMQTRGVDGLAVRPQAEGVHIPRLRPRVNANAKLDSFEAVMQAMDTELARMRPSKEASTRNAAGKGKAKASATEARDTDIQAAMDAELRAALVTEQNSDDDGDNEDLEEGPDYNMIKNFLESFKSQGGLSGPVGSLAGRLEPGWTLPRDET